MKEWIKQQLREDLKEMAPVAKPVYGQGAFHRVYTSKRNPNVLYKVGDKGVVMDWINVFQKYPKLFPRIYRAGEMKNTPGKYFVEIEKLDTQRVLQEWWTMNEALEQTNIFEQFGVETVDQLFRLGAWDDGMVNDITTMIKQYAPKIYRLYVKWVNFIHTLNSVVHETRNDGSGADIHRGNFAYDSSGNIKCIDI